ncbi:MAG: hypothetical protein GXO63_00595 [Candidatus Micrarchaeota archaeon]|nr:hypothetical protein [Candidatus Micrarchaeota archaeon]
MICLVAFVVFGFLGLFSVRYRTLAREAFECVFRRIRLRKCSSGLDRRIKHGMVKSLRRFPRIARFVYRRFEIISWIFTISFFLSLGYTGLSIYNLAVHGSCSPGGECPFSEGCGHDGCTVNCTCPPGNDCSVACEPGCECGVCKNES